MGRPEPTATNSAHTDANQNFSIIGVIGTLGTADARGTALTLPVAIDPSTGAMYVNNLGASGTGGGGTVVQVAGGTINVGTFVNNGGTVAQLTNGSIVVTAGTMVQTTGTINVGTVTASLNPLPLVNPILHGGTAGTLGIGTLITAASMGAGTAGFITGFQVTVISGSAEVILAFGTQVNGPQVIMHGGFPAGGGIARDIQYPHGYGTTNSAITYQILSGSGTVAWDVNYFPHT